MEPLISAAQWQKRDLDVLWHPCTQMQEHPDLLPLLPIAKGEQAWLIGHDGRRYLDAVSSWWTNLFGHCEPRIAQAITAQTLELEHVMLAGFGHMPAIELAEALLHSAPRSPDRLPLAKVFYADNGSAAVEVALKMAFHYFYNRGELQRNRFVALQNGYHGETLGALAVGDIPLYRQVYGPLLSQALFAPSPDAFYAQVGESAQACALRAVKALESLFARHGEQMAAFILEPRVQCAGGMRMYDPVYLHHARCLCDQYSVLLIADEIATGFGRTGTMFACEQGGIMPDLMCVSKGLTGGFLPLAAVLTTKKIYDCFLHQQRARAFLHSHSYTGNPLACAAALATLKIFETDQVLEQNRALAAQLAQRAAPFREERHVADVRQAGMIVAFEICPEGDRQRSFADPIQVGRCAYRTAIEHGVVLRPLANVIYWMPPYCINEEQLGLLAKVTLKAIRQVSTCA